LTQSGNFWIQPRKHKIKENETLVTRPLLNAICGDADIFNKNRMSIADAIYLNGLFTESRHFGPFHVHVDIALMLFTFVMREL